MTDNDAGQGSDGQFEDAPPVLDTGGADRRDGDALPRPPGLADIAAGLLTYTDAMFTALRSGPDGGPAYGEIGELLAEIDETGAAAPCALLWACLVVDLQPPHLGARKGPDARPGGFGLSLLLGDTTGTYRRAEPGRDAQMPRWLPELNRLLVSVAEGHLDAVLQLLAMNNRDRDPERSADNTSILITLASSAQQLLAARLAARHAPLPQPDPMRIPLPELLARLDETEITHWLGGQQAADVFLLSGLQMSMWMLSLANGLANVLGVPTGSTGGEELQPPVLLATLIQYRLRGDQFDMEPFGEVESALLLAAGLMAVLNPGLRHTTEVMMEADGVIYRERPVMMPRRDLPGHIRAALTFSALAGRIADEDPVAVVQAVQDVRDGAAGGDERMAAVLTAGLDLLVQYARKQEREVLDAAGEAGNGRGGDGG